MQSLLIVYSALAVFGLGVTLIDLFGALDQLGSQSGGDDASSGEDTDAADAADGDDGGVDGADTGADGDSGDADGDAGADFDDGGDADADGGDGGDFSADDADADSADDADGDTADDDDDDTSGGAHSGTRALSIKGDRPGQGAISRGSYVASAESSTRFVTKIIGALRTTVYFSLGAGLTGIFSLIIKQPLLSGALWSGGAGVFIATLAKGLRRFIRKDLDSSLKPEEFIMDKAVVSVSIASGAMGRIIVRRYDVERELFARAKNNNLAIPKGEEVRIIDIDDDCYWVEPL